MVSNATVSHGTKLRKRQGFIVRKFFGVFVVVMVAITGMVVGLPLDAVASGPPPTEPGTITASAVTSTSATLTWARSTDPLGIEGYRIYRTLSGGPQELIATTDNISTYTAASLWSNTHYTFGVTAIDVANNESAMRTTTVSTATSTDTTVPMAPSGTSLTIKAFSSTRLDVVWSTSSSTNVAYYEVFRVGVLVATIDVPNAPRYSDNGLAPSTSYSYTVDAVSSNGVHSALTGSKPGTTTAAGVVLIARGPVVSDVTATAAVISWWTNIPTTGVLSIGGQTLPDGAAAVQHHQVPVSGLAAAVTTPYAVAGTDPDTSQSASATGSVSTAAAPGTTFSFAAIGDFGGGGPGEVQNAANIGMTGTQFVQSLGDNIYPAAGMPDPNFTTTYSDFDTHFYKELGPDLKAQAFFPANGNKEYYSNGEFWVNFPMPGTNHQWYSYNWGDAHVTIIDSEQPMGPGSAQYQWIQSDLAANQSEKWRIIGIQRPPYSSTSVNSSSPSVQALIPMFQGYRVNLVLSGNSHNYERSFPLLNGAQDNTNGITYIVSGAGGAGFDKFNDASYPEPTWSAFRESAFYEFAKITVSPTSIQEQAIRSDTVLPLDSTTINPFSADTTAPTVPTGLAATGTTTTSVPLSWAPNAVGDGVTGYDIFRNGTSIGTTAGTGTTFTDATVSPGTTYQYTVEAVDGAGNVSPASAPEPVTTPSGSQTQLVQSTGATQSGTATTLTANFTNGTASGDLLVVSASEYVGATNHITSVTDTAGNTWTKLLDTYSSGHNSDGALWYSAGAHPTTSVTVHTASSASISISAQEFSGVATASPVDGSSAASNTGTTASTGSVTPSVAGDLAVGFVAGHTSIQPITVTAPGFTAQTQQNSGSTTSVVVGTRVLSSLASQTFTATFTKAMYWTAGLALFKPASGSPPPPNDFSISASPTSGSVTAGSATTSTISTAVTSGVAQSVALSATGAPTGTLVSFSPTTVTAGGSSTMTVSTTGSTPTGATSITVTGTGASATHTTSFSLTVNPVATNDFSISASPSSGSVTAGSATTSTISTAVTSGVAQSVALSATGAPTGTLVSFAPQTLTAGTGTSTMTVTTSSTTPAGTYPMTVTGTGASATHTTSFSLTVQATSPTTPAFLQYAGGTETAAATSLSGSFPTLTTSGDLLVLSISEYNGATNHLTSVTDTAGNTWIRVASYNSSGHNSNGEVWYSAGAQATSTVTAHTASATSMSFVVQEFSGVATTSPVDTDTGSSATGTSAASGSITSSTANYLAVGFVAGHGNGESITVTAPGYATQPQQTTTGTITTVLAGYQVLGSPGSTAFAATFPTAMYWAAGVTLFRPAT
jgi:fibronectin type 3 domain-containing protein